MSDAEKLPRKPLKLGKYIAIAVVLLIVAGLALIHLMPFNGRIPQFEKSASAALQQPVKIRSLNFALFPQPHWRLQSVSIGGEAQVKIGSARAFTDFSGLFSEGAVLKSLVLDSVSLNAEGLGILLFARPEIKSASLRRLEINKAKLETALAALPEFNGSAEIGEGGQWQKITLRGEEGQIKFDLQAKGDKIGIELSADALALPREAVLKLKEIEASGEADRDGLTLSEFRGRLYDGVLKGSVRLKWKPEWMAEGVLDAKGLEVAAMLAKVFGGGKLDGKATYTLRGGNADQLFAAPRLEGNFIIHNGILHGVDLKQVIKGEIVTGTSVFNEVAGEFIHEGGVTQLPRVGLTAGLISAVGKVGVQADKKVQGQFEVELKSSLMKARANLGVSGTTEELRYTR
ncbi:MAG: AsmA family protein [Betaproteobacteria bacterium ADurb.Bin341]|nr:MAG: AsmA family protein [Betaproteobacteria bacterium ADurb.Bin341]